MKEITVSSGIQHLWYIQNDARFSQYSELCSAVEMNVGSMSKINYEIHSETHSL